MWTLLTVPLHEKTKRRHLDNKCFRPSIISHWRSRAIHGRRLDIQAEFGNFATRGQSLETPLSLAADYCKSQPLIFNPPHPHTRNALTFLDRADLFHECLSAGARKFVGGPQLVFLATVFLQPPITTAANIRIFKCGVNLLCTPLPDHLVGS